MDTQAAVHIAQSIHNVHNDIHNDERNDESNDINNTSSNINNNNNNNNTTAACNSLYQTYMTDPSTLPSILSTVLLKGISDDFRGLLNDKVTNEHDKASELMLRNWSRYLSSCSQVSECGEEKRREENCLGAPERRYESTHTLTKPTFPRFLPDRPRAGRRAAPSPPPRLRPHLLRVFDGPRLRRLPLRRGGPGGGAEAAAEEGGEG